MVFTEEATTARADSGIVFAAAQRAAVLSINARPYWDAIIDSTGGIEKRSIHTMKLRVGLDAATEIRQGDIPYRYALSSRDTTDSLTRWAETIYSLPGKTFPDTVELSIVDPNRFIIDTPDTLYLHVSPRIRTGSLSEFMKWGSGGNTNIDIYSTVSVLSKE